ncbi:MAG: hypothetical protein JW737_01660 [Acidobacteria bacterium]|nr:hypothetical protein [Acidobacteriota bacterium]
MISYRKITLVFIIAVLFLSSLVFAEKWYNYYENALDDIKNGNWDSAIKNLELVILEKSDPKMNARTVGLRFIDYLPYYHLGYAYYYKGDFTKAKSYFERSKQYTIIRQKSDLYSKLNTMLSTCEEKLNPSVKKTEPDTTPKASSKSPLILAHIKSGDNFFENRNYNLALEEYKKAKDLIEETGEEAALLPSVNQKIVRSGNKKRSVELFTQARKYYNDGDYNNAETSVQDVLTLEPDNNPAKALLKNIQDAKAKASVASETRTTVSSTTSPAKSDLGVEAVISEGSRLYREEKFEDARMKFIAAKQIEPENTTVLRRLKDIEYTLAIQYINEGMTLYFTGELSDSIKKNEEAVTLLNAYNDFDKKLSVAYQFLSIAQAEEYYSTGALNDKLLSEAKSNIEKLFKIKPDFVIEKEYFSPKIVKLFEKK